MKVCILYGSPHNNRVTGGLLDTYLSTLPADAEITRFDAYRMSVHPCMGCGGCKKEGRCVHRDMDAVFQAVEESDLLVIATPVYYLSAPAPMKAVIDRFQPYFERRFTLGQKPPIPKPRKAVFLLAYGSDKYGGPDPLIHALRMLCTILNAEVQEIITKKDHIVGDAS